MEAKDIEILRGMIGDTVKGIHLQIDAEFRVLNERINSTNQILERVERQTTKTNDRVTTLESKVQIAANDELKHIITCPQIEIIKDFKEDSNSRFEELDNNLFEYKMLKTYPKLAIGAVAIVCVLLLIGTYASLREFQKKLEKEQTAITKTIENSLLNN